MREKPDAIAAASWFPRVWRQWHLQIRPRRFAHDDYHSPSYQVLTADAAGDLFGSFHTNFAGGSEVLETTASGHVSLIDNRLYSPNALVLDSSGNIFVADIGNGIVQVGIVQVGIVPLIVRRTVQNPAAHCAR